MLMVWNSSVEMEGGRDGVLGGGFVCSTTPVCILLHSKC